MYYLYVYRNIDNNKMYVGQTDNIKRRTSQHKSYVKSGSMELPLLYNAMRSYGIKKFEFIIVDNVETLEEINYLETTMIILLNSRWKEDGSGWGYNIKHGGNNNEMSELTKAKLSASQKLYQETHPNPMFGRKHTQEAKDKMSEALIGKNLGENNRSSKLTNKDANEIRKLYITTNIKSRDLAKDFNVSQQNILNILNNRTYKIKDNNLIGQLKNTIINKIGNRSKRTQEWKDNISKTAKGRKSGEKHHNCKIPQLIAKEIKRLFLEKIKTIPELVKEYNIKYGTIYRIIHKRTDI